MADTLQARYATALLARGATEVLPSPTRKARTFRAPKLRWPLYLGRAGSMRIGSTYTTSIPVSDSFKSMLLQETNQ